MSNQKFLQVAVGVLNDAQGRVLVALRQTHQHQGGLWEFPGGKINDSETVFQALQRELFEELGVEILAGTPLITIRHAYDELSVQLNVYRVQVYKGNPEGREGQELRWVEPGSLVTLKFPAANQPIITALQLPDFYAILDYETLAADFFQVINSGKSDVNSELVLILMAWLQRLLDQGITFVQARLKNLSEEQLQQFKDLALPLCENYHATLLFNSALAGAWQASGIHLTSRDLMALRKRPEGLRWLAASCHNFRELQHAQAIGVDFAVLAPVLPTLTHPNATILGWEGFAELSANVNVPVYALGGMRKSDLIQAKQAGAQGIAGIRLFLD